MHHQRYRCIFPQERSDWLWPWILHGWVLQRRMRRTALYRQGQMLSNVWKWVSFQQLLFNLWRRNCRHWVDKELFLLLLTGRIRFYLNKDGFNFPFSVKIICLANWVVGHMISQKKPDMWINGCKVTPRAPLLMNIIKTTFVKMTFV